MEAGSLLETGCDRFDADQASSKGVQRTGIRVQNQAAESADDDESLLARYFFVLLCAFGVVVGEVNWGFSFLFP